MNDADPLSLEYCSFCRKFNSLSNAEEYQEWYDEAIFADENFVAFPALGQLVEGYLLVIPRVHVPSMGKLDQEAFEVFLKFASKVRSIISARYGASIIFEHGSVGREKRAGCCIDHAHWHLVPFDLDPLPYLKQSGYVGGPITNPRQLQSLANMDMPYLFFKDVTDHMWLYQAPSVPSQLFRKLLAKQRGKEDEWDYIAFPFNQNIRATISALKIKGEEHL